MMRCFPSQRPVPRGLCVRVLLPLALVAGLASCGSSDTYAVQERNGNRVSIDYNTTQTDPAAVLKAAESYCRTIGDLHASQIDTSYLRGGPGTALWRTATYACLP